MEANQQVQVNKISTDTLVNMGFMTGGESAVTPKQSDFFDFEKPIDKINSINLADQLKTAAEKPVEEAKSDTSELAKPDKGAKPNMSNLESLADQLKGSILDQKSDEQESVEGNEGQQSAQPRSKEDKAAKNSMVTFLKSRIEKGEFQTWNDYDDSKQKLGEYLNGMTNEQLEELADTNYHQKEESIKETYKTEFFQSLPKHLQYVVRNLADESVDPQAVYAALARVEHTKQLDPKDANDQIGIVQSFLQANGFGTPEEISAQVEEWKEAGTLDKKALQMKPKLDRMQEEQVRMYAAQAEEYKVQQNEAAQWYAESVTEALKDGNLNGLNITKKQQKLLYDKLLLDIKPSVRNGQPINGLWQALEKIQVVEPDFKLLSEITWLATDPKGYRDFVLQQGRNDQQGKITRELKTSQGNSADLSQEAPEQRKKGLVKARNPFD